MSDPYQHGKVADLTQKLEDTVFALRELFALADSFPITDRDDLAVMQNAKETLATVKDVQ